MSDILTQLATRAKKDASRGYSNHRGNFLVQIQAVHPHKTEPGMHRITGYEINEKGEPVGQNVLLMISPTGNQRIPEAGDIMEAQKSVFKSDVTSKEGVAFKLYETPYYMAFSRKRGDLAMHCEALPYRPQKRQTADGGVAWRGNLFGVDTSAAVTVPAAVLFDDKIDQQVSRLLQPWLWEPETRTSVSHDIGGNPVYEGAPRYGISPAVLLRVGSEDIQIFGTPAVTDKSTGEVRRPTPEEIMERVQNNPQLKALKDNLKSLDITPEKLSDLKICLVPAVITQISKMGAPNNGYLLFPDRYHVQGASDEAGPINGYNMTLFRCTKGRSGNNIFVDSAKPMAAHGEYLGPATSKASPTPYQQYLANPGAAQRQDAQQQAQQAPAPQAQQAPQPQQAVAAAPAPQQHRPTQQMSEPEMPAHIQEDIPAWEGNDLNLPDDGDLALLDDLNFDDYVPPQEAQQPSPEQAAMAASQAAAARRPSGPRM